LKQKPEIKKKDGRNKPNKNSLLKIDPVEVEKLASRFWTITEIASFFNCSDKTISNRFSDIVAKGKESGKAKLRDLQLKSAMSGNVTMLIWLGKQYLGQKDQTETNNNISETELESLKAVAKREMENQL
jgi:hypothetical protein